MLIKFVHWEARAFNYKSLLNTVRFFRLRADELQFSSMIFLFQICSLLKNINSSETCSIYINYITWMTVKTSQTWQYNAVRNTLHVLLVCSKHLSYCTLLSLVSQEQETWCICAQPETFFDYFAVTLVVLDVSGVKKKKLRNVLHVGLSHQQTQLIKFTSFIH